MPKPFDIEFAIAKRLEKACSCFGHHRQQRGVVEVAGIVHVTEIERNLGRKGKILG
jgi:hypothetical protein